MPNVNKYYKSNYTGKEIDYAVSIAHAHENKDALDKLTDLDIDTIKQDSDIMNPDKRSILTDNYVLFVDSTSGSNDNDGRTTTKPLKTINYALNKIKRFGRRVSVIIKLLTNENVYDLEKMDNPLCDLSVSIIGNTNNRNTINISKSFKMFNTDLHIENVKLNYTGTDSFIFINENSSIDTFTLANCDIKSNTLIRLNGTDNQHLKMPYVLHTYNFFNCNFSNINLQRQMYSNIYVTNCTFDSKSTITEFTNNGLNDDGGIISINNSNSNTIPNYISNSNFKISKVYYNDKEYSKAPINLYINPKSGISSNNGLSSDSPVKSIDDLYNNNMLTPGRIVNKKIYCKLPYDNKYVPVETSLLSLYEKMINLFNQYKQYREDITLTLDSASGIDDNDATTSFKTINGAIKYCDNYICSNIIFKFKSGTYSISNIDKLHAKNIVFYGMSENNVIINSSTDLKFVNSSVRLDNITFNFSMYIKLINSRLNLNKCILNRKNAQDNSCLIYVCEYSYSDIDMSHDNIVSCSNTIFNNTTYSVNILNQPNINSSSDIVTLDKCTDNTEYGVHVQSNNSAIVRFFGIKNPKYTVSDLCMVYVDGIQVNPKENVDEIVSSLNT